MAPKAPPATLPLTGIEVVIIFQNGKGVRATIQNIWDGAGNIPFLVNGLIPAAYLPSYVDDVLEFATLAALPATGEAGKLYVVTTTNFTYRWSGTAYVRIAASPGTTDDLPEGSVRLYFTNARAAAAAPVQSVAGRGGAVVLAKADVGLGNVDNTSDANKPVSTAQAVALALKHQLYGKTGGAGSNSREVVSDGSTVGGVATIYLTDNGAANGNALFPNAVLSVQPQVNDSAVPYSYGWVVAGDRKSVAITVKKPATPLLSLLGINILSQPAAVPDGTVVPCRIVGN